MVINYDPAKVSVIVGGKVIKGFGEDTFIEVQRAEPMYTMVIGVDGVGTRAKTNNYSGSFTITVMHTSRSNDTLSALTVADEQSNSGVVPVFIKDNNGYTLCSAVSAWVQKWPDVSYSRAVQSRVWVMDSDNIQFNVGGNTDAIAATAA